MEVASTAQPLVLVASNDLTDEELGGVRRLAEAGSRIVAWQHPVGGQDRLPSPDVSRYLLRQGIEAPTLAEVLGEPANTEVDETVIAFFKGLGRAPLGELGRLRSACRYRRLSLWWWAELWLYYDTELRLHLRDIEALGRLLERERPSRLVLVAPLGELARFGRSLFRDVEVLGKRRSRSRKAPRPFAAFAIELAKMLFTGVKASFTKKPTPIPGSGRRVVCFTHASMWRRKRNPETGVEEDVEIYFDRIIPTLIEEGNRVRVVGVGPRVPFRRRRLRLRLAETLGVSGEPPPYTPLASYFSLGRALEAASAYWASWSVWRRLGRRKELGVALTHRGVNLTTEGRQALREAFLRPIPSALRSFLEVEAMLRVETADVLVLYAESTTLGRATVAAAAAAGVPSFAIQHGIMYPHYYSHEHGVDEVVEPTDGTEGVPVPDCTAVFGRDAEQLFLERAHYPRDRLRITGSPKFDALLQAAESLEPTRIRKKLGLGPDDRVLLVASRFSSIGPVFQELVRTSQEFPNLSLVVKPHQAESPEPYLAVARAQGASRMKVVSPLENLVELIVASDALVTVDSFASSEAFVLGRPVLIVNLPNNLQMLVEADLALGVRRGEDMRPALAKLLDDDWKKRFQARLASRRDDFAFGADGGSTDRILQAIYETADRGRFARGSSAPQAGRRSSGSSRDSIHR